MDGGEPTDRECYDYPSFISGFESNRKCLVCDEDLFEKCCEIEEGRTSARNCFVLEHSLTAEKSRRYIDHVHRVIPHVVLNAGGPTQF